MSGRRRAVLTGVGCWLPDQVITSEDIERRVANSSTDFTLPAGLIRLISGVEERRYATTTTTSSDLAAAAGLNALCHAGIPPDHIDTLIFASASHDIAEPATANIVQTKTGCHNASVFDLKNACNSFINALDVAVALIETNRSTTTLITSGEKLSPTVDWEIASAGDLTRKLAAFTLGDGGGACVIEASDRDGVVGRVHRGRFLSKGEHWELSTVLAGGTLYPGDMSRRFFECDSARLHEVAAHLLPELAIRTLDQIGWSLDDIDLVVPHQVSRSIVDALTSQVGFPVERCQVTLDRYGNTAAASIPIALATAEAQGRLRPGDHVLLVGGAAGFSAGVIPIVWASAADRSAAPALSSRPV
jgi:3-oxoacyl-(acyl-carrier-protein) synthase III